MVLNKIIIHEIKKEQAQKETRLILSQTLIPVNQTSTNLIEKLLKSYLGDKILYAEFDQSPGKYFPQEYFVFKNSSRSDSDFLTFSINVTGHLEVLLQSRIFSRGGYLVYSDYKINGLQFTGVFLIRDTEGNILRRSNESFEIQKIDYLDTSNLAMACRINDNRIDDGDGNYISFTRVKQQDVSGYFMDWISVNQPESSTKYTNELYKIINALPLPTNQETGNKYTIDEVRNMVFQNARHNSLKTIDLKALGSQIYGDKDIIVRYVEENNLSLDTEFKYDKRVLKKFVQISVRKDGITLQYSRGDNETKVKFSQENPDQVIIESSKFVEALRRELANEG